MNHNPVQFPTTRATLLEAIRDPAERAAWERFDRLNYNPIFNCARRKGLQEADAHDVAQAILLKVLHQCHAGKPFSATYRFRAWLQSCIKNAVTDLQRKHQRNAPRENELENHTAETPPEVDDIFQEEWLTAQHRRAFEILRGKHKAEHVHILEAFAQGHTPAEIATNQNTTRSNISKVRLRLYFPFRAALKQAATELDTPKM